MNIVLALVGLLLGGFLAELAGALAGAALGYAIGLHLQFRGRIQELETSVADLERQQRQRTYEDRKADPSPAPQPRTAPIYQRGEPAPSPPGRKDPAVVAAPAPQSGAAPREAAPPPTFAPPPASLREWPRTQRRTADDVEVPPVIAWIRDWFLGGNLVVRVGVVVLFIGVGFLLKFAVDREMLPIEFRLAGAAIGGAALLIIGWRLRHRLRPYALALQGGGVGLLYLTAFAALRFYDLLPPTATFAMLVAVAVLSAFLAVGQNALVLAVLGALGGFLAPILTSTDQGNDVVLFSYYALLDAGIVAIAWFRAWRPLNLMAFVFTYGIGTSWGVLRYVPEHFATTEPFVALFFVMFLAVAVLFALRTAPRLTDYVDATLVFGTPVVTMLLQSALVRGRPYAMAFSALALSAVYLLLARAIWRRNREQLRLLAESFLALGLAFVTLAVPLALDGHWTAGTWALEGAAILWVGLRQDRTLAIFSGVLLQAGAAFAFGIGHDVVPQQWPLANSEFLGALLIAAGGLASARMLRAHRERLSENLGWLAVAPLYWALAWWSFAGLNEISEFLPERHRPAGVLAFSTLTALGCAALSYWGDWQAARPPTLLLLPVMVLLAVLGVSHDRHLLTGSAAFVWPLVFAVWFWLLRWRHRHVPSAIEAGVHVFTLWFTVAAIVIELTWQIEALHVGDAAWQRISSGLVPALALAVILAPAVRARWPLSAYPGAYVGTGAAGLALYLWIWVMVMNFDDAGAQPLPYLPIINPVELTQGFVLAAIASWLLHQWRRAPRERLPDEQLRGLLIAFAAAVFGVMNAVLLRTIHHVAGIAYHPEALMASTLVHAALSIFWGMLALGAMVVGTRRAQRPLWFAGAWLLGITLAKMFLVDLSRTGTAARIVSFIGVGVLMLIIGRFSPVPPAQAEPEPETAR